MQRLVLILLLTVVAMVLVIGSASRSAAEEEPEYAGTENCKMCHPDPFDEWSKTAHAKAFDLLVNVGEEKNEKCLTCHATGFGKGGFVDAEKTPELKGVTCEACHGPGADHMGDASKIQREPSVKKTCGACHQKNNIHSVETG
ncbi:MAG: cytochrome c family protein [Armatimonadota bacterium]